MSHEQYVLSVRRRIVETAQAMLDGDIPYLLGARKLATLRHEAEVKNDDADFTVFVAIDSDTDDLPLGAVRELWDKSALEKLQPQIDEAEAWAKGQAEPACARVVARFSQSGRNARSTSTSGHNARFDFEAQDMCTSAAPSPALANLDDMTTDMACLPNHQNTVATGTYLYDNTVECDICIVYSPVRYGSGDYEDPPEVANDIEVATYYLWFGSTTERNHFNAGGGGFSSLQDAKKNAEERPGFGNSVRWK